MNECALVGNGTSVLDNEHGERIDAFENVARFNAYQIKGFEKHVGMRTTLWFNVMNRSPLADHPYSLICIHSWERDPKKCKVYQSFVANPPTSLFQKFDHAHLGEMSTFAGTDYRSWSTGAIAIWTLLKEFETLYLTGFDWWERERHHYADKAVRGALHRPEIERAFIEKMGYRVAFL